jgi:hypothetical protein
MKKGFLYWDDLAIIEEAKLFGNEIEFLADSIHINYEYDYKYDMIYLYSATITIMYESREVSKPLVMNADDLPYSIHTKILEDIEDISLTPREE